MLILGSSGVGKTQLLLRLAGSSVSESSGVGSSTPVVHGDFLTRVLSVGNDRAPVKLELWHTAGQEKFGNAALPAALFRRARAAVIVYDVAKRQSFRDVAVWAAQLRERLNQQSAPDSPFTLVLVGHRAAKASGVDDAEVSIEEGRRLAEALSATAFMECCAATGENVQSCLQTLTDNISSLTPWYCSSPASLLAQSAEPLNGKTKGLAGVKLSTAFAVMPRHESVVASAVRKTLTSSRARTRFSSDDLSPMTRTA